MIKTILLFFFLMLFPLQLFAQFGEYPEDGEWFSFAIEQNGELMTVKNNRVELQKEALKVVFRD